MRFLLHLEGPLSPCGRQPNDESSNGVNLTIGVEILKDSSPVFEISDRAMRVGCEHNVLQCDGVPLFQACLFMLCAILPLFRCAVSAQFCSGGI